MDYEVGDPWPCPACSKDMDRTPEVARVDGEFVMGEICGSWWHAETRLPRQQYKTVQHVNGIFPDGDHTVSEGEWIADPAAILSISTEADALLDAIGSVGERHKFEYDRDHEFQASAAFGKQKLIQLLKAMDGRYVRLELQEDGLLRVGTVNWKKQATEGLLAPIREESRQRKLDQYLDYEAEDAAKKSGEKGENDDGDY